MPVDDLDPTDTTEPDGAPVEEKRFSYSDTPCPKCGNKTVLVGYGLAGGGMGSYWSCEADGCDYFHKEQDTGE